MPVQPLEILLCLSEFYSILPREPIYEEIPIWELQPFQDLPGAEDIRSPEQIAEMLILMITSILNDVAFDQETLEFRMRPSGLKNWDGLAERIKQVAEAFKDFRKFVALITKFNHSQAGEEAAIFKCRIHVAFPDVISLSVAKFSELTCLDACHECTKVL